jgi:hypothetical protein
MSGSFVAVPENVQDQVRESRLEFPSSKPENDPD